MEKIYDEFYRAVGLSFNIRGEIVERPQRQYPYSYDPYCLYKSDDWSLTDDGDYSDRLQQWDYDKFTKCMKEVWGERCGQYFTNKDPKDIEKFLSLYFGKKIKLTGIEQGCNVATGYPYWVFYYREV